MKRRALLFVLSGLLPGFLAACSSPVDPAKASDDAAATVVPVPRPQVVQSETGFVLQSPVACIIGKDCFIQQYPDHDAVAGLAFDYTCGHAVYDGHDGTDFRIPDKAAQARGVAVLAAAPGVVVVTRDGEHDFEAGAFDRALVDMDKACGNTVVIDHGKGWATQYCHMREGSVKVAKGQRVTAGDALGLVGQSGDAAFPHLHLRVQYRNRPVDPFGTGAVCSAHQATTLWAPALRDQMAYAGREVVNAGFASEAMSTTVIEQGGIAGPGRQSPSLVAYVRAINLGQGDSQNLTLYGPDGKVMATSDAPPLDRDKAQYQMFVGQKLTASQWPAGAYRAVYSVTDSRGDLVVRKAWQLALK